MNESKKRIVFCHKKRNVDIPTLENMIFLHMMVRQYQVGGQK
jgi:hypothetical protein